MSSGYKLETDKIPTAVRQIKVPTVNGDKYPLEKEGQKFQVIRCVFPEDAKEVGIGSKWGNLMVGIQLLPSFPSYEEANDWVRREAVKKEDWCDYLIVEMYQWLELPPSIKLEEGQIVRPKQTRLDDYMKAAQVNKIKEATIMDLRLEISKDPDNKADACNIMLDSQKEFTLETTETQLKEIIEKPDDYPESMVKVAKKRLRNVQTDLAKLRSLI